VILFVSATKLTTAANAIILQYTAPVYTALFGGWFLNEKSWWYDWLIITAVLGGMVLIFFERLSPGGYLGNILAAASGIVTAWLTLFLRKQKKGSPLESVILGNLLTLFVGLPFMFGKGPSLYGWVGLAILGLFQLGLPFFLYTTAIKYVPALDAILLCSLEPVLNPVWVFLFLKETPGRWALLGGGVIITAVTLRAFLSGRFKNEKLDF
jgi:drug/metabolite transporter (DMT)-like permease